MQNLVQIGFEFLYVHDLEPRSRNDLDLQNSHTFINSIRCLLLTTIRSLAAIVSETSSPNGNDRSPENKQVFLNSPQVSKIFFQLVKGSQLCSPWLDQILTSIKGRSSVANLQLNDALQSQSRSCQS